MINRTVLHIVTALTWRGGEQQVAYLLNELKGKVNSVVLCSDNSAMADFCKINQIKYYTQPKKGGLDLRYAKKIKSICKIDAVTICHLHDAHAHTYAVLSALIFSNKCNLIVSRRVDFPIKRNWFSRLKYNYHSIKKIICVSEKIKEITAQDIHDQSKLTTIYSGIDLSKFKTSTGRLKQELNLKEEQFLIGNTSALADHKDYFTFIDTANKILQKDESVHFVIMGKGPLEDEIKAYAKQHLSPGTYKFLGFRTDIATLLSDLDLFLITSKTEGLGTSILDAFACRVPVVATNAGGIPELVSDRKTGLLCPVKDSIALANAVLELKTTPLLAKKIIENAFNKVQGFSKEMTAEKTLKIYQSL